MAKSYFYDESISDWRELVKGEQGERGPQGPIGPQGPAIDIETGLPISVDTTVGTRVFVDDVMVYGDTGVRNVANYLLNGWNRRASGRANVSRVGDIVYVQLEYLSGVDATGDQILQLPVGFRPDSAGNFTPLQGHDYDGNPVAVNVTWNGLIIGAISDAPTFAGSFRTRQAWPTTLPWEPR